MACGGAEMSKPVSLKDFPKRSDFPDYETDVVATEEKFYRWKEAFEKRLFTNFPLPTSDKYFD
jgi:hypothetical protein